jgi:hypothetical protein
MDKLTICKKCGSDACYSQEVNESITNYQCMGCGFISNSLMVKDSDFFKEQSEILPELYKDLLYEDKDGRVWMPSTVNIPTMGMVFANGTNKSNWHWSAVRSVPVTTDEDKEKYIKKDGTPYEHRMDMENIKNYSEKDYMEALEYIGVFEKQENGN